MNNSLPRAMDKVFADVCDCYLKALDEAPNYYEDVAVEPPQRSFFFNLKHIKMNHVNLIGKLTSSPRFYVLPSGRKVAQFTMSTRETYLDDNGNTKDKNHWHRISAWGKWTKIMEELGSVGMELAIEGKLITRFYHKGGEKRFISEVEVNDLIIM